MALIKCPDCGSDVSSTAPSCPKCGRPIAMKVAASNKKSGCLLIIVVLLILAVVIVIVRGGDKPSSSTKSHSSSPPAPPQRPVQREVHRIAADRLFDEYRANEVATDDSLKGADVEVTGRVQEVAKDFTDSVVISLETSNQFMPARMNMEDSERSHAAALKPGMTVAIVCQKMQRIMGSPLGSTCRFSDQARSAPLPAGNDQLKPQDVAALLSLEGTLDDKCAGSGDDFACAERAFVRNKIMKKGWCWGPDDAPSEADKSWIHCVASEANLDPILSRVTGASFDCSKAANPDELLICSDQELSLMDGAIGGYYEQAKSLFPASSNKTDELLQTQRQFLNERRKCEADRVCVKNVVARRMNTLVGCSSTYCDL